jgi:hypothetical protein
MTSTSTSTPTPLVLRLSSHETGRPERAELKITAVDRLPSVVEMNGSTVVHSGTRVTEVQRETTDDN